MCLVALTALYFGYWGHWQASLSFVPACCVDVVVTFGASSRGCLLSDIALRGHLSATLTTVFFGSLVICLFYESKGPIGHPDYWHLSITIVPI